MPKSEYQASPLLSISGNFLAPIDKSSSAELLISECNRYVVSDSSIPLENLDQGYTEYVFGTVAEGNWNMRIYGDTSRRYNYVNGNTKEMEKFERVLATRQQLDLPSENQHYDKQHARILHFMAANIGIVDKLLTNGSNEREKRDPMWFIEAKIPKSNSETERGKIVTDLILIGSDNRIRLLEVGNGVSKTGKVIDQLKGLENLYRQVNGVSLPHNRILPYVVQYGDRVEGMSYLSIYPPSMLERIISQGVKKIMETNPGDTIFSYFAQVRENN